MNRAMPVPTRLRFKNQDFDKALGPIRRPIQGLMNGLDRQKHFGGRDFLTGQTCSGISNEHFPGGPENEGR